MREYRIALIVSTLCMLCVAVAVFFPEILVWKSTGIPAHSVITFQIPPEPAYEAPVFVEPRSKKTVQLPAHTPNRMKANKIITVKKKYKGSTVSAGHVVAIKSGYYIQLGLFQHRLRAKDIVIRMKHTRWKPHIVTRKQMYAVWVGPWKTRTQVDKIKHDIQIKTGMKGFVIHKE